MSSLSVSLIVQIENLRSVDTCFDQGKKSAERNKATCWEMVEWLLCFVIVEIRVENMDFVLKVL